MGYCINREEKIKELKGKNISIDKKIKELKIFDNIVLCPYRGHKIDLRDVRKYNCNIRADEFLCPECDEWVWWNTHLPWFQQAPYPISSSMIKHPENYKCIVNPNFEKPDYIPTYEELNTWYDKDLNPIRLNTIPINPGEKAIPLNKTIYVAIKR